MSLYLLFLPIRMAYLFSNVFYNILSMKAKHFEHLKVRNKIIEQAYKQKQIYIFKLSLRSYDIVVNENRKTDVCQFIFVCL